MSTVPRLALLVSLAGCTSGPTDDETEGPPPLPVSQCGMEPYVPVATRLGEPLDLEELDGFRLPAAAIDALMTTAGVGTLAPVDHGARVFRFRYTTQDRGREVEATGLIGFPDEAEPPDEAWPVTLLLHGFAGASDACAPSGDPLLGPLLPALLASKGFVAIAPDYIGMNGSGARATSPHAPLVGEQMAFGAWDAVRATRSLLRDGSLPIVGDVREDVTVWGASQGGHGAMFVALAAPYLAPEEDLVGVVASSPAVDLRAVVTSALSSWSDATGVTALAFVGMRRWYEQPADLRGLLVNEEPLWLADTVEAALTAPSDTCAVEVDGDLDFDEVSDLYTDAFVTAVLTEDWDQAEPWSCFLGENSLPETSIAPLALPPILTVYGEGDPLVVASVQRPGFEALCEQGWDLHDLQCARAGHAETTLWSIPEQLDWLRARLRGEPLGAGCVWAEPTDCSAEPVE